MYEVIGFSNAYCNAFLVFGGIEIRYARKRKIKYKQVVMRIANCKFFAKR
jgi:hypothetical protein